MPAEEAAEAQASEGPDRPYSEWPTFSFLRSRLRPVGGSQVRRLLTAARKQAVGPFLFFDHFGPEELEPFADHDVRPHPHIGLSTVTYLFEENIVHRDSIGSVQAIEPGAINWMTAGRGIAHAERSPQELKAKRRRTHGLQLWAGLPKSREDGDPGFAHTAGDATPEDESDGVRIRVLIGRAWGMESPVVPMSETLYVDISLPACCPPAKPCGSRPRCRRGSCSSAASRSTGRASSGWNFVSSEPRAHRAGGFAMGRGSHSKNRRRDRMGSAPGTAGFSSLN